MSIIIVMGVSGCGKTTVGKALADHLSLPFFDADNFHPRLNIFKLSQGIPLNDKDRQPWLELLANNLKIWEQKGGAVLACSALKESYRNVLSSKITQCNWVYLYGSFELIASRLKSRSGHYMDPNLLQSQFDTLQPPQYGIHIDISNTPEKIIELMLAELNRIN